MWGGHDGVGSAEGNAGFPLNENIFFPEEGKVVIRDGWEVGRMDATDDVVEGKGNEADVSWVVGGS